MVKLLHNKTGNEICPVLSEITIQNKSEEAEICIRAAYQTTNERKRRKEMTQPIPGSFRQVLPKPVIFRTDVPCS